ncbi:hypothetical protein ACSSS7_006170 [Eimeria intestinalis]
MGANNSTCLPCKVTGAAARRLKAAGEVIDPRDGEEHIRALKKVSTAAEPQAGSRPAAQASTARGSPTNHGAAAGSSSQPLEGFIEVNQQQPPYAPQEQPSTVFGPTDSKQLQQGPVQHEHDPKLSIEEADERPDEKTPPGYVNHSREVSEARVDNPNEGVSGAEHLVSGGNLQHQNHIHVPSHMLATETEASWQQHHDSQQALLSPHSCSVAHRVAAALRAAAGERAAAAAKRAAEAVKAAKAASKADGTELQKSLECQQDLPPPSSQGFRGLRSAAGNTKGNSMGQASSYHSQQRHSPQNGCLSQVPCFNASEESGNELTITENPEVEQGTGRAPPSDHFVVAAAKRVGHMFSSAAAAAASVASAAARGENCGDSTGDLSVQKNQRRLEDDGFGSTAKSQKQKALDFLRVIPSVYFRLLQAVTLLSQSISVAASVVEVVKKCGDASPSQGAFHQAEHISDHDESNGDLAGYYEALRMSAQQQLSERTAPPQIAV